VFHLRECAPVTLLRNVLRWQATASAISGLALVFIPGVVVEGAMAQPPLQEGAWVRLLGVAAVALAAQMVLVQRRVEDLWWWTWSFVALEAAVGVVFLLNALLDVPTGAPSWPWWAGAGISLAWAGLDVAGLARAGTERSPL
jgi:hypothetical protein